MKTPDTQSLLVSDLLQDANLVSLECLNNLSAEAAPRVAAALQCGGEIEVRARLRRDAPPGVAVWLFNKAGEGVELGSHNLPPAIK